jgi:lipoprotein-anchoring transpeptidase ErfK/SrfK
MQRACLLGILCLSTMLMSGTAFAGPFDLHSDARWGAASAGPPPTVRPASAQAQYAAQAQYGGRYGGQNGGGFIDFLLQGGRNPRSETTQGYQQYPADLGPGMVEAPDQPGRIVMDPRFLRQEVPYGGSEAAGTIIINTRERMLYLVRGQGRAMRYGIGVGRPGFTWSGVHRVTQKREWPDWTPPDEMLKRRPDLPRHMNGGPDNPLGARAMYLGSTLYRIHGSNEPWTIGTQVSSGCIRMRNEDVIDLYGRVQIGSKVVVI